MLLPAKNILFLKEIRDVKNFSLEGLYFQFELEAGDQFGSTINEG